MSALLWSVWSRDDRTEQWMEVNTGLTEEAARGIAARANARLGRVAYQAVSEDSHPAPAAAEGPAPLYGVTQDEAAHVLWHFGEGGVEAGSFTRALVDLMTKADQSNGGRLGQGFPGYYAAITVAMNDLDGIDRLRVTAGPLAGAPLWQEGAPPQG
jgi:hypothetical protein